MESQVLQTVELPSTLTKIGISAFEKCEFLSEIISHAVTPPVCADDRVFDSKIYGTASLSVPVGSRMAYTEAQVWKNFSNITTGERFTISVEYDNSRGSATINGVMTDRAEFEEGETAEIVIRAADNFQIAEVTINGNRADFKPKEFMTSIAAVTEDMTISATFKPEVSGFGPGLTSGVIKVYGKNSAIYIEGADENDETEIYNISGICIYRGTERKINIDTGGVYIVRISGRTFKVTV